MKTFTIKTESKRGIYLALFLQEFANTESSIIEYTGPTEDELLAELMKLKESKSIRKVLVIIEKGEDGIFSAYTPETKTTVLNGQGKTADEAIADLKVSFQEVIESYKETEGKVPDELLEPVEFEFKIEEDGKSL